MNLGPVGMIGGMGMVSPMVGKGVLPCELEELLLKISNLYPNLSQEKENALVRLSGNVPHVGHIKVQTEGKQELEQALNHLFLASTVACQFNQTEKKEFQVRAFVWTPKSRSLTLAYKGISATMNVEGYLSEGVVNLSRLVDQFKAIWEEAKRVRDLQEGYIAPTILNHTFSENTPLQETPLPKGLFTQMLCKC